MSELVGDQRSEDQVNTTIKSRHGVSDNWHQHKSWVRGQQAGEMRGGSAGSQLLVLQGYVTMLFFGHVTETSSGS